MRNLILILIMSCGFARTALAADYTVLQRFTGIIEGRDQNEFKNVNDKSPFRRRVLDMKKIGAEVEVKVNPVSKFEIELEVEHGGVGTALEYDALEEGGEFEVETERGGEVEVEEAYYGRKLTNSTDLLLGKAPLYFSLSSVLRYPLMYQAAFPANLESRMIPVEWAEPGVQIHQRFWDFTFRGGVIAGLNSEFFRRYNWVGGGHQRQFEDINVSDPSFLGALEYGDVAHGRGLGFSYYYGRTKDNRRVKNALTEEVNVYMYSVLGQWRIWRLSLLGQVIRGRLTNTDALYRANNNATAGTGLTKPNAFANVGQRAALETLQLNYEFIDTWNLFLQYEHADTFVEVQGARTEDPRYDVRQTGWGVSHVWDDICVMKFQHFREWTHMRDYPTLTTYAVQFAFDTGYF